MVSSQPLDAVDSRRRRTCGCDHDFGTSKSMWHPGSFLHGPPCCFPLSLDSFDHRITKPWQLSGYTNARACLSTRLADGVPHIRRL